MEPKSAQFLSKNEEEIFQIRKEANLYLSQQTELALNWELDTTRFDTIPFKGYTATYKNSEVTGNNRLFYDRNQPWEKHIRYYNRYKVTDKVDIPKYYIIPQAWRDIMHLIAAQPHTSIYKLKADVEMDIEGYYINDYKTRQTPFSDVTAACSKTAFHAMTASSGRPARTRDLASPRKKSIRPGSFAFARWK